MPPAIYSKPYPVTKGLSQFVNPPDSSRNKPLSLDDETRLAVYRKQPVYPSLKKVVRFLKEPLELFSKITLEFSVTIESDCGILEQLHWELTIKEACSRSLHCVLDGLGVIHQGLFHSKILLKSVEKCLNNEERNETDGSSKQLHVQVEKLKELKENLLKLNKFLDRVLLHYSNFSVQLPTALVKDIKHAAKKIGKVVSQLKPDRLTNLIPNCKVTEEDILCSVLGLNDDFADRLKNLSPEMRRHRNDMYFLLCFLKEQHETLDLDNLHDRAEILREMGFTENRSDVIAEWIAKQTFPKHKSLLAWAEIYIENLFKYDIFLNDQVSKFPYKESIPLISMEESRLNRWFNVNVECVEDESDHVPQVSVINVATEEDAKIRIQEKITDFQANNPEGQLYFHGTDHNGAKNILEDGINLGCGKQGCDFSKGVGFYVADHFEHALDWAKKNKSAAVILFSISSDYLDSQPSLDLRGPENRTDWLAVTRCFRSGKTRDLSKTLSKSVKKCQYIIGPIAGNGVPQGETWINVEQICIRKQEMADEVGDPSHIVGIVFLNTEAA